MRSTLVCAVFFSLLVSSAAAFAASEDADYRRAQYLYDLHEYKLASEAFSKYLGEYPKSERAEQARLFLAETEYQLKDYPAAKVSLEKFLSDFPSAARRADALQRAVKVYWYLKEFAKSVECAEIFVKENSERLSKPDAAAGLRSKYEQILYYGGDSSYGLKKYDAAKAYWEQLQKEFPKSPLFADAAEGLGWISFDNKNYEESVRNFTLTAQAPEHPKAAKSELLIARALDQLGKSSDALAALEKIPGLTGGKDEARDIALWRPAILLHAKRTADALEAFKQLATAFPNDADAALAILEAATQSDDAAHAADALALSELYLSAFPKAPDRAPVARVKTRALVALKRLDEAKSAAQAGVQESEALAPAAPEYQEQRPAALITLAELSGKSGLPLYEKIVKEHAASRFALPARYQIAFLLSQDGKLTEALAQAKELLKQLDENGASVPAALQTERTELRRKTIFAAADYAFRANAFDQAEIFLKAYADLAAVKADPTPMQLPLVSLHLAWCRSKADDFAGAIALLDKAIVGNPGPEIRQEMLYLRGFSKLSAATKAGADPAAAAGALDDYSALMKDAPASLFAAHAAFEAAELLARAKPADALAWLDKLVDNNAAGDAQLLGDGLLLRAKVRFMLGKPAEALSDMEALSKRASAWKGNKASALIVQATCLEAIPGKENDAEAIYGQIIAEGPADSREVHTALQRRGKLRFNAKKYDTARDDFATLLSNKDAKAFDADELEAAVLAAMARKELKDAAGAQAELEKLAAAPLTGAAAFEIPFQLGNLLYESGKHADAASSYRRALDAAAQIKDAPLPRAAIADAWSNLAWCYRRTNELKKADGAFDELIKLEPLGPLTAEARYWRARTQAELNNADGAISLWKEILDKQSDSPFAEKAMLATADLQLKSGRTVDAAKLYEQYVAGHAKGEFIREALCGLAESKLHDKKPDEARAAYMKVLGEKGLDAELDETNERAMIGLAQIALDAKKSEDAKKLALRIVIDRPDSKVLDQALLICGNASEDAKETAQAIGYYRKILSDRPQSERASAARERLQALGAGGDKKE